MTLGERAKTVDHAHQAEILADSLGDERRLGRANHDPRGPRL
jgi:hypothetical protein